MSFDLSNLHPKGIMEEKKFFNLTRRDLLKQFGLASIFIVSPLSKAIAQTNKLLSSNARLGVQPPVLEGPVFDLTLTEQIINVSGKPVKATLINGSLPGPTLRMREGQIVTINVHNKLNEVSALHWHGILLPYQMDGVLGMSFDGIAPNTTFTYQFPVKQSGTYWYHAHAGFQEQTGVIGALIIDPAESKPNPPNRDVVVVLSDWTNKNPANLLRKLNNHSHFDNYNKPTFAQFLEDAKQNGLKKTVDSRKMWNQMRMDPTDFSDLTGEKTFRYLINGYTTEDKWRTPFKLGETIRLRLINAAAQTIFDFRISGLTLSIEAADGNAIQPINVEELRIAPGETYDVIIKPKGKQTAYTLFAQSIDRTGFVAGTLASNNADKALIPPLDKIQRLLDQDMMGDPAHTKPVQHAQSEFSWQNEMRVDTPRVNLDDPGVNLRNNGRKVLTYAMLNSLPSISPPPTPPEREIELHITGNMARYVWGFDGLTHSQSRPLHFKPGQRTRIKLVNDTMMTHPIHLHGMWLDLLDEKGRFKVRKHTVIVHPAQMVEVDVTPIEGLWPLHCHLFYHMVSGMFREVVVSNKPGPFKNRSTGYLGLMPNHAHPTKMTKDKDTTNTAAPVESNNPHAGHQHD